MALKIEPQTFKSSYIKLIALLCSLVYSLLFVIFIVRGVTFIGNLIAMIVFGLVYLVTTIIYILVRNVKRDCNCLKTVWLVDLAYAIGGIFYYVGRNFYFLTALYTFTCYFNDQCMQSLRVVYPILLGMSLVLYRFIPFFISKYYQSNLAKEHQTTEAKLQLVPEWILAAESLTLLVDFDALYTIIASGFIPTPGCTSTDNSQAIGAWLLWALFIVIYIFILYYTMSIQSYKNCSFSCGCVTSYLGAIVAVFAFGLYLLSSDLIPLSCSRANDIYGLLISKSLVLIVVIIVIVLLLVYRCLSKTRQEKLLPRALYQHLHPEPDEQNNVPLESNTNVDEKKDTV